MNRYKIKPYKRTVKDWAILTLISPVMLVCVIVCLIFSVLFRADSDREYYPHLR